MRSGLTARPRDHHQPRPQPGHTISSDHRGACRGRGGAGLTWLGWTASGRAWWRPRALLAGRRSCRPGGRGGGSSSHQPRLDWTGGRNWWWGTAALQTSVLHCRDTAECGVVSLLATVGLPPGPTLAPELSPCRPQCRAGEYSQQTHTQSHGQDITPSDRIRTN